MNSFIWVTTEKEGFHFWKQAPKVVGFLKYPHRHIFHFKVAISVEKNDREIEFFMFKNDIQNMINDIWYINQLHNWEKCKGMSCEMISDKLYNYISEYNQYKNRIIMIRVSEDKENGSIKTYNKI